MKIEINEKGPRSYYDEITYIKNNYSRVLDDPGKPARTMTSYVMIRIIGFLVVIAAAVYLYLTTRDMIYGIMSLVILVAEVSILITLVNGIKMMHSLMDADGDRVIEVNEEGISCTENGNVNFLDWESILCIAINKRSIAVLPRETALYGVYAPIKYRDELEEAIRSTGHHYMIEDNVSSEG